MLCDQPDAVWVTLRHMEVACAPKRIAFCPECITKAQHLPHVFAVVVLDDQDIEATEAAARAADVLETLRALLDDRDREEA